jgi:metal-sulfur cluster biosynthetic enzyme
LIGGELMDTKILTSKLREVLDPELGINVYDLGLIYTISEKNGEVSITMTLTTPGCPLHDSITSGVRNAIASLDGIKNVAIELVWSPAWSPEMMSEEAKALLGH